jgi:hypothetical protein
MVSASNKQRGTPTIRFGNPTPSEPTLDSGNTVYGNADVVNILAPVVQSYDIWIDHGGTVAIPEEEFKKIPLVKGWESKLASMKLD